MASRRSPTSSACSTSGAASIWPRAAELELTEPSARVQLDDVAVVQHVLGSDLLAVENPRSPDSGVFERGGDVLVDEPRDVQYRRAAAHRERLVHRRRLAGRLRVDAHDRELAEQERRDRV